MKNVFLQVFEGFTDVSIVKNLPPNVLTSVDEIIITDSKIVVPKRKAGGRKRLIRECTSREGVVTPNADAESTLPNNNNNLTAAVIAALSNITSKNNDEDGGIITI